MPRIPNSTKSLIVSFNGNYGSYIVGDEDYHSADWEGDDVKELADEVCVGDPDYLMYFVATEDPDSNIKGCFYSIDELEYPEDERGECAVMMTNAYFYC